MTTIEKIKAEIKRISSRAMNEDGQDLCGYLLSFLDTLESEKPMNLDFEQELYNRFGMVKDFTLGMRIAQAFYDLGCRRTAEKFDEIEYNRQRAEEKQMNQDGLEEEIREYMSNEDNNPFDWDWRDKRDCARHFAKWQKEQMMKEAVEGEYGYFSNASKTILPSGELNLKEGDKVRVIVCKKEDEK